MAGAGTAPGAPAAAEAPPPAPPGAAPALAAGREKPPNSVGWPVCLLHASQSRTSDIVKTTHSRVRRISVMGAFQRGGSRVSATGRRPGIRRTCRERGRGPRCTRGGSGATGRSQARCRAARRAVAAPARCRPSRSARIGRRCRATAGAAAGSSARPGSGLPAASRLAAAQAGESRQSRRCRAEQQRVEFALDRVSQRR